MHEYTYLALNLFTVLIPLLLSFDKKVAYFRNWKFLFPAILISACIFLVWDHWFTANGVWSFNKKYILGPELFGMPIEEWLFFFTVPFASIFIYETLKAYLPNLMLPKVLLRWPDLLIVALIAGSLFFHDRLYTVVNFCFAIGILLVTRFIIKPNYLSHFTLFFIIQIIPFLFVNGILTGSIIHEEVVWYNPSEIIGVRIFTIPVEDSIYSLSLMLLNINLFEFFKSRRLFC